jgi:hypothetical protein
LAPVIVLVLGCTAIPVELRRFDFALLSFGRNAADFVANLILYIPVGMVLTRLGFWRALMSAAFLSLFAETCQFFIAHRHPSPIDLALNVAGAVSGLAISRRWRIDVPAISVNVRTAWLSVVAGLLVFATLAVPAIRRIEARWEWEGLSVNCRGAASAGSLEAHWTFDEVVGGVICDSSGNGLDGTLIGRTVLADGVHGMAVRMLGENDYVHFGHPVDLRLMGSITVCAWINSASFPIDDAAIVSTYAPGYQLDTTVDMGPRTIGFKLDDPCGNLMARYGATELVCDTWYHVAGVYDADARSMHVYLNSHLDDGFLRGPVASAQRPSGQPACVGRRADSTRFQFAGRIDDVQIYSRALTRAEIEKAMNGVWIGRDPRAQAAHAPAGKVLEKRLAGHAEPCRHPTHSDDADVPGLMVAMGMLSASACAGFWPGRRLRILGVSLAVGVLLRAGAAITLSPYPLWTLPLLSLTGGASVAFSLERPSRRQ